MIVPQTMDVGDFEEAPEWLAKEANQGKWAKLGLGDDGRQVQLEEGGRGLQKGRGGMPRG